MSKQQPELNRLKDYLKGFSAKQREALKRELEQELDPEDKDVGR